MKNIPDIREISQAKSILYELAREGVRNIIQVALVQVQEEFIGNHFHLLDKDGNRFKAFLQKVHLVL